MAQIGIGLFLMGVGGIVYGSAGLVNATRISLGNIRAEATLIRQRQAKRPVAAVATKEG